MARFHFILLLVFWCASLSITVIQQSSLLNDVKTLWKARVETEEKIENQLTTISKSISDRRKIESTNNEDTASSSTVAQLLKSLEQLEASAKKTVSKLEHEIDRKDQEIQNRQHQKAVSEDEAERQTNREHFQHSHNNKNSLPPLKPMRTECKNYGALDALNRLVKTARMKLYEPYPEDLLRQYAEGKGNSQIELIKLETEYANLNSEIEGVLDHLESTMPKILELWTKWFREDGEPIPAPKFLTAEEGGEVHPSEKYGRPAYEEEMRKV